MAALGGELVEKETTLKQLHEEQRALRTRADEEASRGARLRAQNAALTAAMTELRSRARAVEEKRVAGEAAARAAADAQRAALEDRQASCPMG